MDVEIVALKCPACGNTDNVAEREVKFGYEFKCQYCSTTSIIIFNRQLYVPLPGEHVCPMCGRVAPHAARFCQCGASLIRRCINKNCLEEFPVDHKVCDHCGWPQEVDPLSEAATEIRVQRAIRDLFDSSWKIKHSACAALGEIGPAASSAVPILARFAHMSREACWALGKIGPAAVSALAEVVENGQDYQVRAAACAALGEIGPAASSAVSVLVNALKNPHDDLHGQAQLALIYIGESALPALERLTSWSEPKEVRHRAKGAIKYLGKWRAR